MAAVKGAQPQLNLRRPVRSSRSIHVGMRWPTGPIAQSVKVPMAPGG